MSLLLLAACGPLRSQSGYSDEFQLPASLQVGTASPAGLTWAAADTSARFEGVVVATWSPTSRQFLAARAADPELAAETPNVYFLAEEGELHLAELVKNGHMTAEQAADTRARMAADGAVLFHPEVLAGVDARALRWADVPAKWFPYFFTCDAGSCEGWSGHW